MSNELRFDGRVAIVTGAGGGLGRAHALLLASRGAWVVVNDLGSSVHGEGNDANPADAVVAEIEAGGGRAVADYHSVEDGEKIVQTALDSWGRIDIVVNNAGVLRDRSFLKMSDEDWQRVQRVHLHGAYQVTHAAWPHMRENTFGRIVMTSSSSGLYGNFGQANYSAAKLALLGFAHTLAIEGEKYNIFTNTIAPVAATRMTEGLLPPEAVASLKPEYTSPLVAYLCHERTLENHGLFEVGGGWIARLRWQRTRGAFLAPDETLTIEKVAESWPQIADFTRAEYPDSTQSSFAAIIANLAAARDPAAPQAATVKQSPPAQPLPAGGKVDLDTALGHQFEPTTYTYTQGDVSLYALSIGAASDPLDLEELKFVYELNPGGFHALPTFGVIVPAGVLGAPGSIPGLEFHPMMLVHGEQYMELKQPLPTAGTFTSRAKIAHVYDKRAGALVIVEATSSDERGQAVVFNRYSLFIRGLGGFGGERGPSGRKHVPPKRDPDAIHRQQTNENQALLYRLPSGDGNPLHADPAMAAGGGFERPILHGLCTFGFAGRAVLKHFADNEPARFKSIGVRFSRHVFPGETLVTEMWRDEDYPAEQGQKIIFRCKVAERDEYVLTDAAVVLHS